jgi:hypothetical protein
MEESRNSYSVFVGKPKGKRPLEITRRRWQDNIKMDVTEIGWGGIDRFNLAQDWYHRLAPVNTVMNLRIP